MKVNKSLAIKPFSCLLCWSPSPTPLFFVFFLIFLRGKPHFSSDVTLIFLGKDMLFLGGSQTFFREKILFHPSFTLFYYSFSVNIHHFYSRDILSLCPDSHRP